MEGLIELVIDRYDGSLKAEHGTGVNMAPFVEREWGAKATELMRRVKRLADPDGVLAPGVVLNDDPGVHLRNLKTTPAIEDEVTTCVECGFCEPVCPSRHLTTTPRQRIVLRREMARQRPGSPVLEALLRRVRVRRGRDLRRRRHLRARLPARDRHRQARQVAARGASTRRAPSGWRCGSPARWESVERAARAGLGGRCARSAGQRAAIRGASRAARSALSSELVPEYPRTCRRRRPRRCRRPLATGRRPSTCPPASTGSSAGPATRAPPGPSLPEALVAVSERAGLRGLDPARRRRALLRDPVDVEGLRRRGPADGQPHDRRALALERRRRAAGRLRRELLHARARGRVGRAAERGQRRAPRAPRDPRLDRLGARAAAAAPGARSASSARSPCTRPARPATSSSTATWRRSRPSSPTRSRSRSPRPAAGSQATAACSTPSCRPAATADEAAELGGRSFDAHLCSNRTCEIGLQQGTGRAYESFVFALEELTRN